MKFIYLKIVLLLSSCIVYSQHIKVVDSLTQLALPYPTVTVNHDKTGLIGDENGIVSLHVFTGSFKRLDNRDSIIITYIGYQPARISLEQISGTQATDTIFVSMQLLKNELPPIVYRPPSPDSLLIYAFINTLERAEKSRSWQQSTRRISITKDSSGTVQPMSIIEEVGERFTNKITPALIIGSRQPIAWITTSHARQLGTLPNELHPHFFLTSDLWINYDFSHYLPYSPQYFNKKMEKIFDANGDATHIKIQMTPIKFSKLSPLRIVDNKISLGNYSLLNTNRTFYIDLSDTTISEIHVEDVNEYKVKGLPFKQSGRTTHYKFERDKDQTPFLAFGSFALRLKADDSKKYYQVFQQIWLGQPENADAQKIAEIAERSKSRVTANTYKRDGEEYLFSYGQSEKVVMNDSNFWRGKKTPDHLIARTWYALFAADPHYPLFVQ